MIICCAKNVDRALISSEKNILSLFVCFCLFVCLLQCFQVLCFLKKNCHICERFALLLIKLLLSFDEQY